MDTLRTPRTIATLVALVLSLALAAPAHAATPSVGTARAIALEVWGPAPCGKVRVAYDAWDLGTIGFTRPDYANLAASDCAIHLDPDLTGPLPRDDALLRCHTIVHEWGHLTGHHHTRRGIMAPRAPHGYYWRCRQAARP